MAKMIAYSAPVAPSVQCTTAPKDLFIARPFATSPRRSMPRWIATGHPRLE
jgi:hypothetical protein